MKKLITIIAVLALLLVGTGCKKDGGGKVSGGGNKLVCTQNNEDGNITVTLTYKGDTVNVAEFKAELDVESPEEADMYVAMEGFVSAMFSSVKGIEFKMSANADKTKVFMVYSLDLENLDYAALAALGDNSLDLGGITKEDRSLKAIRAEMEGEGYTCK